MCCSEGTLCNPYSLHFWSLQSHSTIGMGKVTQCCHLHLITLGWSFEKADIPSKFLQMLLVYQFMTALLGKTSCL